MNFALPPFPSATSSTGKIKRTIIIVVVVLLLVMGGLFAFRMFMMMQMGGGPMGGGGFAVAVNAAPARAEKAERNLLAVGTLRAQYAVDVAAEVAGRVAEISDAEGKEVKKGDVLARLDDTIAKAEVEEAKAALELAEANYGRASNLAARKFGTERARDEAEAAERQGKARLALAAARLEKMDIKAPFNGVLGLRAVSLGAYVSPGTPLFSLSSTSPIQIDFRAPELKAPFLKVGQKTEVYVDAIAGRVFEGVIVALDPQLDEAGRSLGVRAQVDNADGALRPGMFARVKVNYGDAQDVLVVPERAIFLKGIETFVYRVVDDKAIEAKVRLGERRVGEVEILEGIAAGDDVVSDGQIKLREGAKVMILGRPNVPKEEKKEAPATPDKKDAVFIPAQETTEKK